MTLSPDQKYMVDKIAERAFPGSGIAVVQPGMTLRDYFAAAALQGLLASGQTIEVIRSTPEGLLHLRGTDAGPKIAYEYADAMLKEREK